MEERRNSDQERKQIAKEAADEAVRRTFETIGIDISTPESREKARATWAWLQSMQNISNKAGAAALWTIVTLFISGMAYAFWQGIKHFLKT